ncbi:MAG TPA: hypothetical protein ENI89_01695 [Desulfobulbus sp.]|nr:hypothetical protein [Desulfobulbus sp.]
MGSKFWANVALCVFLGIVTVLGLSRLSSALTPKGLFVEDPKPSPEAAALMDKVKLVDYRLSEKPGQVVSAEFYVENHSDRDIKDLDVLCEFYDRNGRHVDRKFWLLADTVPAGKAVRHTSAERMFVNTRASGLRCQLADFRLVKPPFFRLHRVEGGHHGGEHGVAEGGVHGGAVHGAVHHGGHGEGGH